MIHFKGIVLVLVLLISIGCSPGSSTGDDGNGGTANPPPGFQLTPEGVANALEIATWNLEHFPLNGTTSIERIAEIIKQLDIDIFALQEIEDISAFQQLLDKLPEYNGLFSDDQYQGGDYQKTGIIFKNNLVTVVSQEMLFSGDSYAFPRPPLLLRIDARKNGKLFDFFLIIIHLKAFDDAENRERRRAAALALKNYMDEKINGQVELEKDYIVAGDWNDEIDDPESENAFQVFIDAPGLYQFLTLPLTGNDVNASYPSRSSLIDHILVSADCLVEYQGGSIKTLRIDDSVGSYFDTVSDHRPVMAVFPVF